MPEPGEPDFISTDKAPITPGNPEHMPLGVVLTQGESEPVSKPVLFNIAVAPA